MLRSQYSTTEFTQGLRERAELCADAGRRHVEITPDELEELCAHYEYLKLRSGPVLQPKEKSHEQVVA